MTPGPSQPTATSSADDAAASPLDVYCIAIGGTGMAPLACLLQEEGHRVRGSDLALYPPMSTLLEEAGIEPYVGFDAQHLSPLPDLVVVGNAVPRNNPEAQAVDASPVDRLSMPEALARFFLASRRPLVVAGAHGKTTVSSMAAWVYTFCGADPGYLVGGWPLDLPTSFRRGEGPRFIVEGDEYNAAYFDRGPKFLHYRPETLILTSVDYDHADLYPDPDALLSAYRSLLETLPARGTLIACGDSPEIRELIDGCETSSRVVLYGLDTANHLHLSAPAEADARGTTFSLRDPELGEVAVRLGLWGEHNVSNALAVWAAARNDGLAPDQVVAALEKFQGVRRRLEELGRCDDVIVVDDFAHHPTEVAHSLAALGHRFEGRRRVAIFEPRSLTAGRSFLFGSYREAFCNAERVLLAPIYHHDRLSPEERLDREELAVQLGAAGVETTCHRDVDELLAVAVAEARPGDVLVTMSSGSFEGLPARLVAALESRSSTG